MIAAALIPLTRTAVVVLPERGIVRYGAVVAQLRADCQSCSTVPCWVHCNPEIYVPQADSLATIERCQARPFACEMCANVQIVATAYIYRDALSVCDRHASAHLGVDLDALRCPRFWLSQFGRCTRCYGSGTVTTWCWCDECPPGESFCLDADVGGWAEERDERCVRCDGIGFRPPRTRPTPKRWFEKAVA